MEGSLVGWSPKPGESAAVSGQIASELTWVLGHPDAVRELLDVVCGKKCAPCPQHTLESGLGT